MTPTPKHIEEARRERSPETDIRCRQADISQLLNLLLLRHSAVMNTKDKNHPDELIIEQARDNALAELKWRFEGLRLGYSQLVTRYNNKEGEAVDARGENVTLRATLLAAQEELETLKKQPTQGDSLVAAIEGNDAGMSHADLVLTVQMLRNGRKRWMDEANQLRTERDELKAKVSRLFRLIELAEADNTKSDCEIAATATFKEAVAYTTLEMVEQERDELKATVGLLAKEGLALEKERGVLRTRETALLAVARAALDYAMTTAGVRYGQGSKQEIAMHKALSALEPLGIKLFA